MVDTDVTARATCEVLRVDGIRRDRILLDCVSFTYQEAAGSHLRTGTLLAYFLSKSRRERPSDRLLLLFFYRNGLGKLATGARWVKLFVEIMRDRSGWSVLWSDSSVQRTTLRCSSSSVESSLLLLCGSNSTHLNSLWTSSAIRSWRSGQVAGLTPKSLLRAPDSVREYFSDL